MKRTKREENAIIINFILFSFLLSITLYIGYSYIYPNMKDIEQNKADVKELYTQIQLTKNKGVLYSDFKDSYLNVLSKEDNESDNSSYIKSITESIDEDFYNKYFQNNTDEDFQSFINKQKSAYQNSDIKDQLDKKLNFVLPSYVDDISDITHGEESQDDINYLTDFRFINYIETLVEQFNLKYNNPIGINDIKLVDDYAVSEIGNTLDKNIYYIPVELDMEGQKGFIFLFLYYLENVGTIQEIEIVKNTDLTDNLEEDDTETDTDVEKLNEDELNEDIMIPEEEVYESQIILTTPLNLDIKKELEKLKNSLSDVSEEKYSKIINSASTDLNIPVEILEDYINNKIDIRINNSKSLASIYKNDFFTKNIGYRKINNYNEKGKYNIFNNQLIDIEKISFEEYIDSDPSFGSLSSISDNNLLKNINSQLKDNYKFKAKLRFYIKGLPKFKIEKIIKETSNKFESLKVKVENSLGEGNLGNYKLERLKKVNETLKSIGEQLIRINSEDENQIQTLTEKYNNSYEIKKLLIELENEFNQIITIK